MGIDVFAELFGDVKVNLPRFIHGEESVKLHRAIPPEGNAFVEGEITNIYDKVKGALIVWRLKVMTGTDELLAEAEHGVFYVETGLRWGSRTQSRSA